MFEYGLLAEQHPHNLYEFKCPNYFYRKLYALEMK